MLLKVKEMSLYSFFYYFMRDIFYYTSRASSYNACRAIQNLIKTGDTHT